jgi:protein involved in polysaccharide export with SLBB domain
MKKGLSLFALLFCAIGVPAAHLQSPDVRVGPLAEEKIVERAPAPKKEEKPPAAKPETPSESKDEPKPADTGEVKKASLEVKNGETATKTPSAVSANTTAAPESISPSVTTDAPPKSTSTPVTPPLGNPSAGSTASGNPSSGSAASGAPSNSPAKTSTTPVLGTPSASVTAAAPLTSIYRIGAGDVLDIRLLNDTNPRASTLFTVMAGGVLEYPLAGDPINVAGMTAEELAGQLIAELKRRAVYDKPQVRVSVREYASHMVMVSGLANDPGAKVLRREAVPLYVVIAEAQPKPEAGRAVVISHTNGETKTIDLNDAVGMNVLVHPGDVVTLISRPPEFFYIGGQITSPGQKDFHAGLTLTQAVLASGGVAAARPSGSTVAIRVSRQGKDGRLVANEYVLQLIEEGILPDPVLQPGDRIEVSIRKK